MKKADKKKINKLKLPIPKKNSRNNCCTKKSLSNQLLQDSELKYRTLFEAANDAIILMDKSKYLECNKKALKIFGCRKNQIIGKNPLQFSPKFQPDGTASKKIGTKYISATLAGKPQFFEWRHLRYNGTPFDAEVSLSLINTKNKKLVQAIIRDVTSRKLIEQDMIECRQLLENAAEPIWMITIIDNATGEFVPLSDIKFRLLNRSVEKLFGYTVEEYAKKSLGEIIAPESFDYVSRIFVEEIGKDNDSHVDPNRDIEIELQHYHKNGSIVDISVSMKALRDKQGKMIGAQGITRDITARKKIQRELEASGERFRELADLLPGSVFECDRNFNITFLNKKAISTFGYSEKNVQRGLNIIKAISSEEVGTVMEYVSRLLINNSDANGIELTGIKRSGEKFPMRLYGVLIYQNNKPVGLRGIAIDISDQKARENALRQSEERYRTIIENIEDGYYEADLDGNLTYFNDAVLRMSGNSREEMFCVNFRKFCKQDNGDNVFQAFHNVFQTRQPAHGIEIEWEMQGKSGKDRIGELSASLIQDANSRITGFRGIVRDVTERRKAEEIIKKLAYHDSLTGLPNRRLFSDRLNMALKYVDRNESMLAVMMIDLDRFKEVNDSLGHLVGDMLLKAVGKRLTEMVRTSDTIARMGGDEFMVLLMTEISTHEDIAHIADKILHVFEQPVLCNGHVIKTTPSIGIAVYPEHGDNLDDLVRNADIAMYRVKEGGRNNYKFYDFI
jgi:diguanylate cyclase (GGDEF)-like protein/PAS domain S-box-containing protein